MHHTLMKEESCEFRLQLEEHIFYGVTEQDKNHAYLKSKMHKMGGLGVRGRSQMCDFILGL